MYLMVAIVTYVSVGKSKNNYNWAWLLIKVTLSVDAFLDEQSWL